MKTKKTALWIFFLGGLYLAAIVWARAELHARPQPQITTPSPWVFAVDPASTLANCGITVAQAATAQTWQCFTGDGKLYTCVKCSSSPGTFVPASFGGSVAGVQKVQGVAPGATGNVQLNCTLGFPATAASFSAGNSTTATIPAASFTVPCTGQGN